MSDMTGDCSSNRLANWLILYSRIFRDRVTLLQLAKKFSVLCYPKVHGCLQYTRYFPQS